MQFSGGVDTILPPFAPSWLAHYNEGLNARDTPGPDQNGVTSRAAIHIEHVYPSL